ncbi:hypothetical protein [Streptomyces sp. S1D4-20]|uniref:hypothetical protein n=1 Tax=Streptomyces sp. S1D4-20 TaxID=2594462 RepID=UPI001164C4F5|nr:hypothetical protein [Streptomyces sp. S1D4-20]QDN57407.1 hypothetical protein FNV67_20495 [Streptomyces sp. S1D4-20]
MKTTTASTAGQGRITIFSMFGPVFGYASRLEDGKQVAYIGPVTPGVDWRKLWQIAERCNRATAAEPERAAWIISQANRSLISGSDVVVKLPDDKWEMDTGGWRVPIDTWCWQDALVTGSFSVPALTAEQIAVKPTLYPHYAS